MAESRYDGKEQVLMYTDNNGDIFSYECHNQFEGGVNEAGEPHESLPNNYYPHTWAEDYDTAINNGKSYGAGYIHTGDERGRDIHGGGSSLSDPYADRQGWLCTYGCLRMQNEDIIELSKRMIADGNDIPLTVVNNENAEEL